MKTYDKIAQEVSNLDSGRRIQIPFDEVEEQDKTTVLNEVMSRVKDAGLHVIPTAPEDIECYQFFKVLLNEWLDIKGPLRTWVPPAKAEDYQVMSNGLFCLKSAIEA